MGANYSHSPVSGFQPHYSFKEVQLCKGLQNADRLATCREGGDCRCVTDTQLNSRGLVKKHLCYRSSLSEEDSPHLKTPNISTRPCAIAQVTSKAPAHFAEETHAHNPTRVSNHTIHCCRSANLIHCLCGNKNVKVMESVVFRAERNKEQALKDEFTVAL